MANGFSNPASDIATSKAGQIGIIVIVIAVIVIVFIVIIKASNFQNTIMEFLGLKDDKDEKETNENLAAAAAAAASGNWFSPSYYKSSKDPKLVDAASAKNLAKTIYDSVGYVYDNSTKAAGAIKQLSYKSQVSQVADVFQKEYSHDLKAFMDTAFDTDDQKKTLASIYNYVKNLNSGL